ncbi:MAG: lysoplasmalogenase [Alistipes sp.]|nr:lysoplasmalogenase [Alistipes sp.]
MRQFSSRGYIVLVMIAYCILATIYFVQHYAWDNIFGITVALPTLFATTLTAMRRRHGGWFIPLALGFSMLGDYAGSTDNFTMQVAMFAVAHIFFICDFWPKRRYTAGGVIGALALVVAATLYVMYILPSIEPAAFRQAIVIYAIIIVFMATAAILQERKYRLCYIVAALLFVFSDGAIAYGMAMGQATTHLVMPTYYAAQAIFTILYMLRKQS